MKKRIAIAIEIIAGLLFHTGRAKHIEDFTPVLYTEKRTVRVISQHGKRSMTYGIIRGEKLQHTLRHSFHDIYRCWRYCLMRLNFSF
jgi:hypothetical protein